MAEQINLPNINNFTTIGNFLDYYDSEYGMYANQYSDISAIKYDASNPDKQYVANGDSPWLAPLVVALNKCGIKCENTGHFDLQMESAISEFQKKYMKDNFWYIGSNPVYRGVLDAKTLQQIFSYANNMPDYIDPETGGYNGKWDNTTTTTSGNESDGNNDIKIDEKSNSPHYNSFFDTENSKQFRQNHKNIRIVLGNSGIVKEIRDVIMRGVGVEVDTSGNPISETYEFIARDITETDEEKDADNYINGNGTSPSDVKYRFNFDK